MAIAEIEANGVVADLFPAQHLNSREILVAHAAVLLPKDVAFTPRFGAGRSSSEFGGREVAFSPVAPDDGNFLSNDLDLFGRVHEEA